MSDIETAEDVAEAIEEMNETVKGIHPEDIAAIGTVVVIKDDEGQIDGQDANAFATRVIGPEIDGYESPRDVIHAFQVFNDTLEDIKIDLGEQPPSPEDEMERIFNDLMMGGEGGPSGIGSIVGGLLTGGPKESDDSDRS